MVTRDDVARLAGTSSAVVSYVINGGPRGVAEETRRRVLAAVDELGYRPNAVARALRSSTSRVLGLVVPDIANPFFAELAGSIEQAAFQRGYALFLGNAMQDDARQAGYLQAFADHQVQGMLLIGAASRGRGDLPPATKAELRATTVPVVFLDRKPRGLDGTVLAVDNRDGAWQATRHLVEHGHREVACLAGPKDLSPAWERNAGWEKALRQAGIDPRAQLVTHTEFDRYAAFEAMRAVIPTLQRPQALFVHSDEQAIGVLHASAAAGVRVPQDLAVASFDGIRESQMTSPRLTTVRQPVEEVGRRAVELVIQRMRGETQTHQTLPVALQLGESCGCGHIGSMHRRGRRAQVLPAVG